ncbi:MAG TPA: hypothetical protein VNJ29_03920 [Candidatus Nitrosotenuis sp.]|jgi:hypothetical protein|nr:hypothetical protein [Candidatus Nitrosotenuis sp.]
MYSRHIFAGLLFLFIIFQSVALPSPLLSSWKKPQIANQLKKEKVISMISMRDYLKSQGKKADFMGNVFLVELANGLRGVFKSFSPDDLGDAYAEVAAYKASLVLGFPYVPPTVIRTIKGKRGSLQLFVETTIDPLAPGVFEQALTEADLDDVANLKIFYFIFGQWDTGPHNILIYDEQGKKRLIAIDNSGIRNHQHVIYGDLPFVRTCYSESLQTNDWGKPFPFDQVQTIANPTPIKLKQIFGTKLPKRFYQSFTSYNQPFCYVIYQNSLWRQYHAFDKSFIKSYTSYCPTKTLSALKKLDLPTLKRIFACAQGADFLTPSYFQAILERRDQVLKHPNLSHLPPKVPR